MSPSLELIYKLVSSSEASLEKEQSGRLKFIFFIEANELNELAKFTFRYAHTPVERSNGMPSATSREWALGFYVYIQKEHIFIAKIFFFHS